MSELTRYVLARQQMERRWFERPLLAVAGLGFLFTVSALALRERVDASAARPNAHSRGRDRLARIRIAADASADPDVRALLEAAAADEIDEIALEKRLDVSARRSS